MDNPIDHSLDLGLVNYTRHPSNQNYIVFRFADANRANSFELVLSEENIWFEKGEEEKRNRNYILFGIHKTDYKKVQKINYLVEAKHRKKLIPFAILRYFLLIGSATVLTLAIVGYCEAQKKLEAETEALELENIR